MTLLGIRTVQPPFDVFGNASSSWRGKEASGLAQIQACPELFPRRPSLKIELTDYDENTATVKVIGRVEDPSTGQTDIRPVSGATVQLNDQIKTTDTNGIVILSRPNDMETMEITATAGNTFESAYISY
jgi:hypothetical protein